MASLLSFCIGGLMRIRTRSSTRELRVQVHGLIVCPRFLKLETKPILTTSHRTKPVSIYKAALDLLHVKERTPAASSPDQVIARNFVASFGKESDT
jgi:hypothetical protein